MMEKQYILEVSEEWDGIRVDKFLPEYIDLSRSFVQKLIKDGNLLVNEKPAKGSQSLKEGDQVYFTLPESKQPEIVAEPIPLNVLYEDEDVIIINKPKDMVVHPSAGHYSGTLVNALLYHCHDLSGINGVLRPGIVHRIDKDTTGSIIACKNDIAHERIAAQLKEHAITRRYLAICRGVLKEDEYIIDKPIGRALNDRKKMAVNVPGGKSAITHVKVLERLKNATYIECQLETGRTHQIRVHLASMGYPLLGDTVYGDMKNPYHLQGQALHAYILGFVHPKTGEYIETNAPIPEYFDALIKKLQV